MSSSRPLLALVLATSSCAAPPCIATGEYAVKIGSATAPEATDAASECPLEARIEAPTSIRLQASDPGYRDDTLTCAAQTLVWVGETRIASKRNMFVSGYQEPGPLLSARRLGTDSCPFTLEGYLFFSVDYRTFSDALAGAEEGDDNAFRWVYSVNNAQCAGIDVERGEMFCTRLYKAEVSRL